MKIVDPLSLDNNKDYKYSIDSSNGKINISNLTEESSIIITYLSGEIVAKSIAVNSFSIQLTKGIYIVSVNGKAQKVLVY